MYEYHPNRQRDLEGTSTLRESTSRYKGCTSLYEYHPSLPKSQREGTSKGREGTRRRVREGTGKMAALSHPDRQNGPYFT